ncbi:MAG: cation-translocating P-type ATPase [Chloroflexota bacterium]
MAQRWHSLSVSQALQELGTRETGLTEEEAESRLEQHGPNRLEQKKKTSPVILFLRQFFSPLIYVLLAAATVSLVTGHYIDAGVVYAVLFLNAIIGFVQEQQAQQAMEALMRMSAPKAQVRRQDTLRSIPAESVVPGDVIVLESGNLVPADARLIEEANLKVNESSLTGESVAADKETTPRDEEAPLAERENMVYAGTVVTHGRAAAVVVETAMNTEIGKIAAGIQGVEQENTPVQESIATLSRYLVIVVLGIIAILVVVSLQRGLDSVEVFMLAVAAAVSAIPEGLPAVVTVVLAVGMRYMAKRNAIVRRLVAVETLGSATVICSDKTGTLTMNEMTVRRIYVDGKYIEVTGEGYEPDGDFRHDGNAFAPDPDTSLGLLLKAGALCNESSLVRRDGAYEIVGDPTEGALVVSAAKAGIRKEELQHKLQRACEIPFESEQQYMAVGYREDGGVRVYVKGSTERVLAMSADVLINGKREALTDPMSSEVMEATDALARDAMRTIALAYVDLEQEPRKLKCGQFEGRLTFLGIAGMADPPRQEVKRAIAQCKEAGIRVVMITGDHKTTARAIAGELNLPEGRTVDGPELKRLSDEELAGEIENISVFARIEPLDKLRIVNALKARNHTVAMTGDGVNDAPALKASDIGVAMGQTGTDVAKQASDMVLADDNFATVVAAVEEGRAIFNRLRNVILFLLSTNIGELTALILAVALVGKAPLLALQIIWINLVTDTAAAIPLGLEPKAGDELKQPPRDPRVGLLFPGLILRIAFLAGMMGTGVYLVFDWANTRMPVEEARTMAFCTMVAFEWFRAFNARSDEHTVFELGLLRNKYLLAAIAVAVCLQLAVIYLPFMQIPFRTVPMSIEQWGIALGAGGSLFLVEETRKLVAPRLFSFGKWAPLNRRRSA